MKKEKLPMERDEFRKALADAGALDVFGREVRMSRSDVVVRADGDDDSPTLEGYAAMFNSETVIGGWFKFREKIEPGAFTKTIKEADVRHLFNHDPNWVLGRNKSGTLELTEDDKGLRYDVNLNMEDPQAVSVKEKVERGDVNQSSFAFVVIREEWLEPDDEDSGELPLRTIKEAKLYDTSTVTYPAYEDTSALISSSARTAAISELIPEDVVKQLAQKTFTPELAPALREVAHSAEELAERCEGESCSRAAEEAPEETETERAAEEAPEEEPVTVEVTDEEEEESEGERKLIITINIRDHAPEPVVIVESDDEDDEDWNDRKRQLLVKSQDAIVKRLRTLYQ